MPADNTGKLLRELKKPRRHESSGGRTFIDYSVGINNLSTRKEPRQRSLLPSAPRQQPSNAASRQRKGCGRGTPITRTGKKRDSADPQAPHRGGPQQPGSGRGRAALLAPPPHTPAPPAPAEDRREGAARRGRRHPRPLTARRDRAPVGEDCSEVFAARHLRRRQKGRDRLGKRVAQGCRPSLPSHPSRLPASPGRAPTSLPTPAPHGPVCGAQPRPREDRCNAAPASRHPTGRRAY